MMKSSKLPYHAFYPTTVNSLLMRDSALEDRRLGEAPAASETPEPELEVKQAIPSKWCFFFASERKLPYALNLEFNPHKLIGMKNCQMQSRKSTFQHDANPTGTWPS